jgi:Uncharacterized protein conserved in bacteria (DUF2252)
VNIRKATESYEKWVGTRIRVVKQDLDYKHEQMARSPFEFLRATFYRWAQLWPEVCAEEWKAPEVLAVGDLHVENFGTWRDAEGRLIWGVNDFDEAHPMAYTIDLVRLATSAHLAIEEEHLTLNTREVCDAILEGYRRGIDAKGKPFVLAEDSRWLRLIALNRLRDPVRFWKRMTKLGELRAPVPDDIREKLEASLPVANMPYERKRRVAGLGSLGHLRVLALARWCDAWVAREAKVLTPSAVIWASGTPQSEKILYPEIISRAARVQDPFLRLFDSFMIRRIAPDCSRILLASLPEDHDEARLLEAMGYETANIHVGSRKMVPAIVRDLKERPRRWLHRASKEMMEATHRDWLKWRKG